MSSADIASININNEISNFANIVGKLSLFNEHKQSNSEKVQLLERPVTPVEQEIRDSPKSLAEFLYLLQRRISISKDTILSEEDQLNLLGIVEGEISLLWPDLKNLVDYPLFNTEQNRELRSSIFVEIITRCKTLFFDYIKKIQFYKDQDIFSDESNLVRIKMQLASEIRHRLHIPTLRRRIYQNISQGIHMSIPECCEVPSIEKEEEKFLYSLYDKNSKTVEHIKSSISVKTNDEWNKKKLGDSQKTLQSDVNQIHPSLPISKEILVDKKLNKETNNQEDLKRLMIDNTYDDENDSFPKMCQAMPCWEKDKLRNEELQRKLEILQNQNEERTNAAKYIIRPPVVKQPATVQRCFKNKVYCVPDIRPTERRNDDEINLSVYGPVWNELADEITPEIAKQLNSNLFRGEEVKDIYKEIMKTVSRDYLSYTDDLIIENCPANVYIHDSKASHTLQSESKRGRIINADLNLFQDSPWKVKLKSRSEWEQPNYSMDKSGTTEIDLKHYVELSMNALSHRIDFGPESISSTANSAKDPGFSLGYTNESPRVGRAPLSRTIPLRRTYIMPLENFEKGISRLPKLMQDRLTKHYKEWFVSWKNNFDSEDYLKFLSFESSDFLSVIFHYYDLPVENTIEEEDEELYPELVEQKQKMNEREQERFSIIENKVLELQNKKLYYEKGLWNPNTIFIGGLGKIPALTNEEKQELLKDKPSFPDPNDRFNKISPYRRIRSAISPGKSVPLFVNKAKFSKESESAENLISSNIEDQKLNAIQNNLELIWNKLKMPNHLRLDMAIKYSSENNINSIENVLKLWNQATNLLLEREKLLSELENFERTGSDPNRFFAKGYQGSSLARREESKIRENLHQKIDQCSIKVQNAMKDLKDKWSDELSYEGRPYGDKMTWDRTEMLYWLQEERKEQSSNGILDPLSTI